MWGVSNRGLAAHDNYLVTTNPVIRGPLFTQRQRFVGSANILRTHWRNNLQPDAERSRFGVALPAHQGLWFVV